jgi:hypothetical protein
MATFPTLKTGAPAQYPLGRGVRYSTQAVRFMDGSRQRFSLYGTGLRKWTLKLAQLDEEELGAVIAFVELQGSAPFAFTDPTTGTVASTCVISGTQLDTTLTYEMDGTTTVVIEEIL